VPPDFVTKFPYRDKDMKMSTNNSAVKYIGVSSRTYELIIDTPASTTRSRLEYWKSVWEIASRPYASRAIGATIEENFERTRELTNLTVNRLHSRSQRALDFSKKLLAQAEQLQDTAREAYRDSLKPIDSAVGRVIVAAEELSVGGASTVDQSSNGRKRPANALSISNEEIAS
jgi:hypothetical protein